jgi:tetratricopeptide (TPR) repeat protein
LDKAESARREELAIQAKLLGLEAPAFTTTLYNLAILLSRQGKLAEAQRCFREAAEHGNIRAMKELALRLATGPDAELRDGVSAVTFAERAAGATNWNDPGILAILAAAYAEAGQFANAVDFQQKAMALAQNDQERNSYASRLQLYQSNSPYRDDRLLAGKVSALLARGNFAEAEPFARECLAHREKELPDDWLTFDTRALLGESLLGQKKYPEAERMLLSGYEGMKQREQTIPVEGKFRLDAALRRLVLLYEAAAREDQAAIWKQREALARAGAETEAETETRASGVTYARLGRFSQAAAAFARVVELHPDDYYARHSEAAALIQCRQIEDYHVLRHQGVQRFMNTTNHHAADQIAKDFLVLPASGPDLETAAKMAETAVSAPANHPDVTWFRLVKCLAEYRQGHFASAVEWAQKVLINSGHFSERDAGAYLVLAMAQHQLKQSEAAHAALAKGLEIVDKKMAELNSGDLGGSWVDWIIAQALLDEARALIDGKVAIPQGVN